MNTLELARVLYSSNKQGSNLPERYLILTLIFVILNHNTSFHPKTLKEKRLEKDTQLDSIDESAVNYIHYSKRFIYVALLVFAVD